MRSAAQGSKERTRRATGRGSGRRESPQATGRERVGVSTAWSRHEHGGAPTPPEADRLAAAGGPDVEDPLADLAAGVVDQEPPVVLPAHVHLAVPTEREEPRVGRHDSLPHEVVAAGGSLQAVGGQLDRHGFEPPHEACPADRPVAGGATHQRTLEAKQLGWRGCHRSRYHDLRHRQIANYSRGAHAHGCRRPDAEEGDRRADRDETIRALAALVEAGEPGPTVIPHPSTSWTSWSSTGSAHPDSSPAIAPMRAGNAYSTRPPRAFLSDRVASTMRSTGSPRGRRTGRPARRRTPSMRSAVPASATPSRSALRPSSTMPMPTASPCSSVYPLTCSSAWPSVWPRLSVFRRPCSRSSARTTSALISTLRATAPSVVDGSASRSAGSSASSRPK